VPLHALEHRRHEGGGDGENDERDGEPVPVVPRGSERAGGTRQLMRV
jgi:hypothetical protein